MARFDKVIRFNWVSILAFIPVVLLISFLILPHAFSSSKEENKLSKLTRRVQSVETSNKKIEKKGYKAKVSLDQGIEEFLDLLNKKNKKIINNY